MRHYERALIDWVALSDGTRRVRTTINVYLFLEFTVELTIVCIVNC